MFERFTDRARRVVVLAQLEARLLDHNHIGTEHILLGLIHEGEGVAAQALQSLGVSLEAVRANIVEIVGRGEDAPTGHIPFTPRAKKVLELSLREALQIGHNYLGTEHILLGLIREGEGVAAQVLVKLGADLSRVRQQVIQLLSSTAPGATVQAGGEAIPTVMPGDVLAGPGPGAVLLSPGVLAALGDLPELRHVIALGRPVPVRGEARLTPISLTIWSSFVELRYAVGATQGQPPAVTTEDWAVEDDLGTRYSYAGMAMSAYGTLLLGTICFVPPPPQDASRFSLLGPAGARLDIELPGLPTPADIGSVEEPAEPAEGAGPESGYRGEDAGEDIEDDAAEGGAGEGR